MTTATENKTATTDLNISFNDAELNADFIKLENDIRTANKSFLIIGKALTEINSGELYKERNFGTFELYVSTMFDFSRDYAYKLMNATRIYDMLSLRFTEDELPKLETHCRPLTNKAIETDEDIIKIWSNVVKSGRYTAKTVIEFVNVHIGKAPVKKDPPVNPEIINESGGENDGGSVGDSNLADSLTAEQKVRVLEAQIVKLENDLEKARSTSFDIARTKMAREMIQKGFAVLVANATDDQKAELVATKKALMG